MHVQGPQHSQLRDFNTSVELSELLLGVPLGPAAAEKERNWREIQHFALKTTLKVLA